MARALRAIDDLQRWAAVGKAVMALTGVATQAGPSDESIDPQFMVRSKT